MNFWKTSALCLLLLPSTLFSQAKFTKRQMKKQPVWIGMIKSEQVNYFDALKAFELYFTTHKFPVMEEEEMGKNELLKERIEKSEARYKKRHRKVKQDPGVLQQEEHEEAKLAFEVKRFNHWEMKTRPYVKNDGTVMSAEERIAIWKSQQPTE